MFINCKTKNIPFNFYAENTVSSSDVIGTYQCDRPVISPITFPLSISYDQTYNVGKTVGYGYKITMSFKGKSIFFVAFFPYENVVQPGPRIVSNKNTDNISISNPNIYTIQENGVNLNVFNVQVKFYDTTNALGTADDDFVTAGSSPGLINGFCDIYTITLPGPTQPVPNYFYVEFRRYVGGKDETFLSNSGSSSEALQRMNNVEVPTINIVSQTLIDGFDIGETKFTISDKFSYYSKKPIELKIKICKKDNIPIEDLKQTAFIKSCPQISSVFIGEGELLYTKVESLWSTLNITDPNLQIFYNNVRRYGLVRYILSRILYGNFNINYLLRKYYKKFLTDLGHSRFCGFVQFFNDPKYSNMYKYFK